MSDRLNEIEAKLGADIAPSKQDTRELLAVAKAARGYLVARENVHHSLVPQYRGHLRAALARLDGDA